MKDYWKQTPNSFKAMIIGKLLGDGGISKQKGRKPRFQFRHVASDYEWTKYCYEQLSPTIPLSRPKFQKLADQRLRRGYSLAYYVQSRTDEVVSYLRNSWYPTGKKQIPRQIILNGFTTQSLAWWYMDDGHLKQRNNKPEKIILSTDSFTVEDNEWLIQFLQDTYNLVFSRDKQNRLVLYDQAQIYRFLYLVTPYMHHSMHRKMISSCDLPQESIPRRTTIYLSKEIQVRAPTKEINNALGNLTKPIKRFKKNHFFNDVDIPHQTSTKSYQIVVNHKNLTNLKFLKQNTGLTYSQLTEWCFIHSLTKFK